MCCIHLFRWLLSLQGNCGNLAQFLPAIGWTCTDYCDCAITNARRDSAALLYEWCWLIFCPIQILAVAANNIQVGTGSPRYLNIHSSRRSDTYGGNEEQNVTKWVRSFVFTLEIVHITLRCCGNWLKRSRCELNNLTHLIPAPMILCVDYVARLPARHWAGADVLYSNGTPLSFNTTCYASNEIFEAWEDDLKRVASDNVR